MKQILGCDKIRIKELQFGEKSIILKSSVLIKEQMRNGPDITNDVMGKGMPVYHIKRVVEETGE